MNSHYFFKSLLISLILSFGFTHLSQAQFGPKFKACVLNAPQKRLEGIQRIAVLNFGYTQTASGNDAGTRMADFLTAQLIQEYRGVNKAKVYIQGVRTNIYEVVERSRLDQILKEQNLQISGAVDDNQAVEIGKLLGLDALIVGNVSYEKQDERNYSSSTNKKTGKTTYTYRVQRTVNTEARMKIISVKTAAILGTKNFTATRTDNASSSKGYPSYQSLTTGRQLADQGMQSIAFSFANYFTPYYSYVNFNIKNIKIKDFKDQANDAEDYLKRGEIDPAYKLYKAIFDEDSYNPRVNYNLGVLQEVVGNYDEAYEYYAGAYELDGKDKTYLEAYQRIKIMQSLVKDLAAMGINIQKYEFQEGGADVLSKKIVLRGGSGDRVPAYESPNTGSTVVAKVPGGLEFPIIEESGGFYLVELRGGKKAYFYSKDVKEE